MNTLKLMRNKAVAPQGLSAWINHSLPLTDSLYAATGAADLRLLSQQWCPTDWWSQSVLSIEDRFVFLREIMMCSQERPYWYAKTLIPESCFTLDPEFFKRLEHESIRNLIFDSPKVERIALYTYPVDRRCLEWHWVHKYLNTIEELLWVRYSECRFLNSQSFYLLELLLPELENIPL